MAKKTDEVEISTKVLNCKLSEEEKATLAERGYKVQSILNEGSCSLVYSAQYEGRVTDQHAVQRNVTLNLACKVMETENAPKDFVQKFLLRELDIISQISHPHVIHTHSILHINTKILVFMRKAEYGNLCDYITSYGGLREKQARLWFRQLAVGIDYLHSVNIVHRDIKCENILITCSFNVKICDFGFARFCADVKGKAVFSTTFCGSIAYAAPELIKGTPYVPTYSDVWSLGVVLYIMLNGIMPFRTDNLGKLWNTQMNKEYRFRTSVIPRTSREAIDLVSSMLEPNWYERSTAREILFADWFALEPSLINFTPAEEQALENIKTFQAQSMIKVIKKIMRTNKEKRTIEVISKESVKEPSDEMDEVTKKKVLPHSLLKAIQTNPVEGYDHNPVSIKMATGRRGSQDAKTGIDTERRTSMDRRVSLEEYRHRSSIDGRISASSFTGRADAIFKEANYKER